MYHLSVIIPAYMARAEHLEMVLHCRQSVAQTVDLNRTEILIQDDASPAFNGMKLLGRFCQRNPDNLGFPGNCNAGAMRARGEVLLFLNQDCWAPHAGWDEKLCDFFELEPSAGVAGPTILFPDGSVQSVGGGFDAALQPYHIALGASNPDWEPINTPRKVLWVTGAAFAVRTSLWRQLGGFDLAYGKGYFEDVDFCLRAQQAGFAVWHRPNVRFYHSVGSTNGNPQFGQNAAIFKQRWVDRGLVEADTPHLKVRFWA
jgi:GT2 family glycosyltransferase